MKKIISLLIFAFLGLAIFAQERTVALNNGYKWDLNRDGVRYVYTGTADDTLKYTNQDTIAFTLQIGARDPGPLHFYMNLYSKGLTGTDTTIRIESDYKISTRDTYAELVPNCTTAVNTTTGISTAVTTYGVLSDYTTTQTVASYTITTPAYNSVTASHTETTTAKVDSVESFTATIASHTEVTTASLDSVEAFNSVTASHTEATTAKLDSVESFTSTIASHTETTTAKLDSVEAYVLTVPFDTLVYVGSQTFIYDTTKVWPVASSTAIDSIFYYANITRLDSAISEGQSITVPKHAIQIKALTNTVAQQTETVAKHAIQVKALTNTVAQQTMANAKHAIQRKAQTNTVAQQTETTAKHAIQIKPLTNTVAQQTMANAQQIATVATQTYTIAQVRNPQLAYRYMQFMLILSGNDSVGTGIEIEEIEIIFDY